MMLPCCQALCGTTVAKTMEWWVPSLKSAGANSFYQVSRVHTLDS